MVQHQMQISGTLKPCDGDDCGRQPKAYHVRGKDVYFLECSPCGTRTAKKPTMQQAVELWESGERSMVRKTA